MPSTPQVWPGFDALSQPCALLDDAGSVLTVNPALASLLGEAAGKDFAETLERACIQVGPLDGVPTYCFLVDGQTRWLRPAATSGVCLLTDVTAQHELAALRASSQMRDALMQEAEIGTWAYDPNADLYYFSNELSLGHGQSVDGVPTSILQKVQHKEDGVLDREIRQRLITEGGKAEMEIRYRDAAGGWKHLRVQYKSGRQTETGLYEMYGLSQNITEQAHARDEAKAAEQRLKLAVHAARAGMFEFDYITKAFKLSAEYRALIGKAVLKQAQEDRFILYHPEDRATIVALAADRTKDHPHADPIDVRLNTESGYRWMRVFFEVDAFDGEGNPLHAVGMVLDIHEQKRMELELVEARETAEAATAAKSDFLASVSHEIRTPMNGIVGILRLLKAEPLSAEAANMLEEAIGCSAMLGQVINDVLDFSKMEAGKLDVDPVPTDPVAVLDSVAALIRPQVEAKGLYLHIKAGEGVGWVDIDPVRLRQCLFNTIGNASKFTPEGGVEVRMSLADGKLRCEIEDTGIGIPQAAQAKLFDRFQQAETGTTRKFGGTGLGLAITRNLAIMMGGDMGFTSVEGKGSTFWFEIAAPPAEAAADDATGLGDSPLEGLTILVVDDNHVNRLVGVKTLEAMGARAEAVDGGQAAVEIVAVKDFDLILMDINMPGMDGMEATRRIRASGGPEAQLPIIAMTADVMTHHQQRYTAAGMNGFVPKPFAPVQLLTEIARLAGGGEDEALSA